MVLKSKDSDDDDDDDDDDSECKAAVRFECGLLLLLLLLLLSPPIHLFGRQCDDSSLKVDTNCGCGFNGDERKIIDDGCFSNIFVTDD